jgi:hypothetical protein
MPATAAITPNGYNLGQGGYSGFDKIQLPGLGTTPGEDPAVNFRKGILFYFGHCDISVSKTGVAKDVAGVAYEGYSVNSAIESAKSATPQAVTLAAKVGDALQTLQADSPAWLVSAAKDAAKEIQSQIPSVVSGMLSTIGQLNVPVAGDLVQFGTNFVSAVKKTCIYWNTRGLDTALRSGEPQVIVGALRKEIGKDAAAAFANAMYNAAKAVAQVVTAGTAAVVTKVAEAIAGFIRYLWDLYKRIRDRFALKKFFADCKSKFAANDSVIFDTGEFKLWFSNWVGELPIIACHCICSPITGSYFGFLSTLADSATLKTAYGKFVSLKEPAVDYAKSYSCEFSSTDPMVKMSLTVIQKGGVDMTNGAAAQSVSWFRRKYMQYGSKLGLVKNTLYG